MNTLDDLRDSIRNYLDFIVPGISDSKKEKIKDYCARGFIVYRDEEIKKRDKEWRTAILDLLYKSL